MRELLIGLVAFAAGTAVGVLYKRLGVRPGWMSSVVILATVLVFLAVRAVAS